MMIFIIIIIILIINIIIIIILIINIYINFIKILIKGLKTLLIISIFLRNKGESNAQGYYPND